MEHSELKELLEQVATGAVSPDDAADRLGRAPVEELGYAALDMQRASRQGVGEVVYGAGKTAEQIAGICDRLIDAGQPRVLVTRLGAEKACSARALMAHAETFEFYEDACVAVIGGMPEPDGDGAIVIACAGTSDLPVLEEAALTAEFLGNRVVRVVDVGVAGIHRLFAHAQELASARVVIAIAGMEGALASVIGGLVSCPVIAVPTSVGYGASFEGLTALLAMLNSCASGVSVVNIDNGFGAAYQARLINHLGSRGDTGRECSE